VRYGHKVRLKYASSERLFNSTIQKARLHDNINSAMVVISIIITTVVQGRSAVTVTAARHTVNCQSVGACGAPNGVRSVESLCGLQSVLQLVLKTLPPATAINIC